MAVEKVYKCDLCGEFVPQGKLRVLRVGLVEDRPEICERIDVGPECATRLIAEVFTQFETSRTGSGYEA